MRRLFFALLLVLIGIPSATAVAVPAQARCFNDVPGITCKSPGGAFYAWPNVTQACKRVGVADSEAFRKRLLHEAGIAVLADIHFGRRVPGDGQHIRFSYAASNAAIENGIARLDDFVRRNTV